MGHDITPLAQAAQEAKSVVLCIHPQSTYDAVAAALTWKQVWEQAGKSVAVVCSAPMRAEYASLFGIEQVQTEVGNRDLVMSFAYDENVVDKVSYNVNEQSGQFELIISPKNGVLPLNPANISFKNAGVSADIVVLFGFHSFNELGEVYEKERYSIDHAFTVAVTQNSVSHFAKMHVALQPEHLNYSEWVYFVLSQLQIGVIDESAAHNLLQGIEYATDRLAVVDSPRTFETVAQLMRLNARRQSQNPAFDFLATPINAPAAELAAPAPVQQWQAPQFGSVPNEERLNDSAQIQNGEIVQLERQAGAAPVNTNQFAQAMGRRA